MLKEPRTEDRGRRPKIETEDRGRRPKIKTEDRGRRPKIKTGNQYRRLEKVGDHKVIAGAHEGGSTKGSSHRSGLQFGAHEGVSRSRRLFKIQVIGGAQLGTEGFGRSTQQLNFSSSARRLVNCLRCRRSSRRRANSKLVNCLRSRHSSRRRANNAACQSDNAGSGLIALLNVASQHTWKGRPFLRSTSSRVRQRWQQ